MFETARAEEIRQLQDRIRGMQRTRLADRTLPTSPALAGVLPGGALAAGGSYVVEGSTALALELLREPSRAGAWCAIVGVPDLGVEAAAAAGIDLERLVLVPHPAEQCSPWCRHSSTPSRSCSCSPRRAPGSVRRPRAGLRRGCGSARGCSCRPAAGRTRTHVSP
jgi:hypothetical protein